MSFSDLMSSSRGPGVIGTLMALVVLAIFGFFYLFVFDQELQGKGKTIEATIAEQAKEIEDCQAKLGDAKKRLEVLPGLAKSERDLAVVTRENQFGAGKLDGLQQDVAAVQEQIAKQQEEFETYKAAYRAATRGQAKGLKMDELKTKDGKVYTKVSVNKVTAQAMHVQHADGITAIPYEVLPDDMQDLYQFDPREKERFLADERAATREHVGSVNASTRQTKEQAEQETKAKGEAAKRQRTQDIAALKQRIATLGRDISAQKQAILVEKHKSLSRAPAMETRLAEMNGELAALNAKLAQLESQN